MQRMLPRWIGIGVMLSAGLPGRATIIDTGNVVLSGNDLVIGNTADGSRTVDADTDGPYDSVTLGLNEDVTGTLILDNASSFTTGGTFVAGGEGAAIVQASNGSTLVTRDVELGTASITLDGDSSWISLGAMTYSGLFPDPGYYDGPNIVVTNGASAFANGILASESNTGADGLDLRVDGIGASWWNDGALHLSGSSLFSVLNGATAHDKGVFVEGRGATRLIVDGPGSTWDTGRLAWIENLGEEDPGLFVTNGGRVNSSSAVLGGVFPPLSVRVEGAESIWSIAGTLESHYDYLTVSITEGATLESGDTRFFCCSAAFFDISGSGSTWNLSGNLQTPTYYLASRVVDGSALLVHGDARLESNITEIEVDGGGSLFRTEGILVLQPFDYFSPPRADLVVANGARVEAGDGVAAYEASEIELHGGTLATPFVALNSGSLTGEGVVDADVVNDGRVAPGVGAGALEAAGFFAQTSAGALAIQLGGLQPGIEHSQLDVLGTAALAGELEVTTSQGHQPLPGDEYEVLRASSLIGEFESYAGLDLGNGVTLEPDYGPTSLVLRAVPEPDRTTALVVALGLLLVLNERRSRRSTSWRPGAEIIWRLAAVVD